MEYILHILIFIGIYFILSVSLNLIAGYSGLLSVAHAAFYGIGAYVAALMALELQSPFLLSVFLAAVLCGLLGLLVGIPSLRMHDDYFVIATFTFQVIVFNVLNNWVAFTGGPMGLTGIPLPSILGVTVSSHLGFLLIVGFMCCATMFITRRIVKSPFGRVLTAIREDEVLTQAAGKQIAVFKVLVFVIGAGMAGMAGVLFAHYIRFIDPTSFTVMESIFIISIVIIGGAGSLWGPVLGAVVLVLLPELLRFAGLPSAVAANIRQLLYGGLLVSFMLWRPKGFLGKYSLRGGEVQK